MVQGQERTGGLETEASFCGGLELLPQVQHTRPFFTSCRDEHQTLTNPEAPQTTQACGSSSWPTA